MLRVAIIGCGYWGAHLIRNFNNSDLWQVSYLCDIDIAHLQNISKQYPGIPTTTHYQDILNDSTIDAVVIASSSATHFQIAKDALLSGKNIWVEKPFTQDSKEAQELISLAKELNLIINVDHTYLYTSAIEKIKEIIDSGELGSIIYIDTIRINLGLFRHDENVLWDLAPHDISIINYIHPIQAISVSATGNSYYPYSNKKLEEVAYITIKFADKSVAHINVNWLSPIKIRQMIIGGTKKMLVFDDMLNTEKIKVYNSGVTLQNREDIYDVLVQYRTGDMYSPALKSNEALATECKHFYDRIVSKVKTNTDGEAGLLNVKILEAAQQSLDSGGKEILL
ncbi:MAG TPA: Gfo/Idh/MocA family oxidoreductase [Candidatus Kapabacteria bacterium]|nr:Gfo/Idh/MocA family oxidoreductase [Candidatus Kapabacteria bacterium]